MSGEVLHLQSSPLCCSRTLHHHSSPVSTALAGRHRSRSLFDPSHIPPYTLLSSFQDEESYDCEDSKGRSGGVSYDPYGVHEQTYIEAGSNSFVHRDILPTVGETQDAGSATKEGHSGCTKRLEVSGCDRITGASCRALLHAVHQLYRIDDFSLEKIGSGFFSDVYKVRHKQTGDVLALKMNTCVGNRVNVLREIQMMNRLDHPNILRFQGVCVQSGQLHALTEFITGGSLDQLIGDLSVDLPWITRVRLASNISSALSYLHNTASIIHRDLTSKNVLVQHRATDPHLVAVVGDFGLASAIPQGEARTKRLATVGSPWWIAPESLKGEFYNQLADMFSFGIILCELISRCEADPDVLPRTNNFGLDYIAFSNSMVPGDCPLQLLHIALKCCRVDMCKRPSASDAVSQLNLLLKQFPATASSVISSSLSSVSASATPAYSGLVSATSSSLLSLASSSTVNPLSVVAENNTPSPPSQHPPHLSPPQSPTFASSVRLRATPKRRYDKRTHSMCHYLTPELMETSRSHGPVSPLSSVLKSPVYKYSLGGDIYTSKQELSSQPLQSVTARHVGEIMSAGDPHYQPSISNPFAHLARFKDGRKLIGSLSSFDIPSLVLSTSPHHSPTPGGGVKEVAEVVEDAAGKAVDEVDVAWLRAALHYKLNPHYHLSHEGGEARVASSLPSSPTTRRRAQERWADGKRESVSVNLNHHHRHAYISDVGSKSKTLPAPSRHIATNTRVLDEEASGGGGDVSIFVPDVACFSSGTSSTGSHMSWEEVGSSGGSGCVSPQELDTQQQRHYNHPYINGNDERLNKLVHITSSPTTTTSTVV